MKKHTRRKVWSKGANPVAFALLGDKPIPDQDLLTIRLRELLAIDAFAKHQAGPQEWFDLDNMHRIAGSMGAHGVGPEALPLCHVVAKALRPFQDAPDKPMGLPEADIQTLRELLAIHEAQRTQSSRATYEHAMHRVAAFNHMHRSC